jgi:hypothetical protein
MPRRPVHRPGEHIARAPLWLAGCTAAGLVALSYLFPGNEHGASKTPDIDSMPSYSVESLVPGKMDEQAHQSKAKQLGVQVCKVVFVSKESTDEQGRHKVIINPVLSPPNADGSKYILPANVNIGKDGFTVDQTPEELRNNNYTVANLDGTEPEGGVLNDGCPTEDVHLVYLKDTTANKPVYELAGAESSLTNGTAVAVDPTHAIQDEIVNYQTWLDDAQVNDLVTSLRQG